MRLIATISFLTVLGLMSGAALASETITYSYDAKGRLVKTVCVVSGTNAVQTTYEHDKADNRVRVQLTGAPS